MAEQLNREGMPTFSGKRWHPLTIKRMVANEAYSGIGYYG